MPFSFKKDLGLKAFKKKIVHGLTEKHKVSRKQRYRQLLKRHAGCNIIFSDEKFFLLQQSHNPQNDRLYAVRTENIPKDKKCIQRFQNVSSFMVWGAISKNGTLPLIFIEKGVKMNQEYYLNEVLIKNMLPEAQNLHPDGNICFQKDSAPAH